MQDQSKTKQVLIQELVTLRKKIAELKRLESDRTLNEIDGLLASDEATRADMAVALRKLEKEITERRRKRPYGKARRNCRQSSICH
jgi:hypothetical protein